MAAKRWRADQKLYVWHSEDDLFHDPEVPQDRSAVSEGREAEGLANGPASSREKQLGRENEESKQGPACAPA